MSTLTFKGQLILDIVMSNELAIYVFGCNFAMVKYSSVPLAAISNHRNADFGELFWLLQAGTYQHVVVQDETPLHVAARLGHCSTMRPFFGSR